MFLMADMGGTNIRFAVFDGKKIGTITHYKCADFPRFSDVLNAYRDKVGQLPDSFILDVPGPSNRKEYDFVNNPWHFSIKQLKKEFAFKNVFIVNDFEAAAMAVPFLTAKDVVQVKNGTAQVSSPKLITGAGTGLGVGILVPLEKGKYKAIHSEGGHIAVCDTTEQETKIKNFIVKKYGRASAERFISGQGLQNIYQVLTGKTEKAEKIIQNATNKDVLSQKALLQMFAFWGDVTGDLALMAGACGGVYLSGGVIQMDGVLDLFKKSEFLKRFENKGRYSKMMQSVPVKVIVKKDTVFRGLKSIGLSEKQNF